AGLPDAPAPRMITCPVRFDEAQHRYWLGQTELRSVSSVLSRLSPPFDPDGQICRRVAAREGVEPAVIRQRWDAKRDAACDHGHAFHRAMQGWVERQEIDPAFARSVEQFRRWPFKGVLHCETILWSERLRIAGTADLLEQRDKTVRLYDFKTNERLEF